MFTVTLVHGGWGSILMCKGAKKEISGGAQNTTNNIMELTAVIEALRLVKYPCKIKVYSDSAYVVNAFLQGWIYNWIKKGWKIADLLRRMKLSLLKLKDIVIMSLIIGVMNLQEMQ